MYLLQNNIYDDRKDKKMWKTIQIATDAFWKPFEIYKGVYKHKILLNFKKFNLKNK